MAEIGATLREARLRARIDIGEVEARTKIRAKYLRAIENEEWDLLPGPVYARSFLRTYGDFLGLDSRMLVEEFRRRYEGPSDHDLRPISSRSRERSDRGPLLPSWAVIGLVLVAVVVALAIIGSNSANKPASTTGAHAPPPRRAHRRHRRPPPPRPTTVKLQLVPTGTVYVCLVDGSGAKLINEQTYTAGQTVPAQIAGKLLLTLGNNAVHVTVNGQPVPVAPSSTAIRLLIEPTGTHPIPLSMPPTCP